MIRSIDVTERRLLLDGQPFGLAGAYEALGGFLNLEVDPAHPANRAIVDLQHAPTNARGRVEARSNFLAMQPVDPERRLGVAVMEVVNRGVKTLFNKLNRWTPGPDHIADTMGGRARGGVPLEVGCMPRLPDEPDLFGDGWLQRHGFTVLWVGWEADVLPHADRMYLEAPPAQGVHGRVRHLAYVGQGQKEIPLGFWGHRPYLPIDADSEKIELIKQDPYEVDGSENREVVPRSRWAFGRFVDGRVEPDDSFIHDPDGFDAGIYTLHYDTADPIVLGLGFAAIRDAASFAKYDADCPFPVEHAITIGRSQTGRFQLDYLYAGVNGDEAGRKALDGVIPHTGGAGRGSFNVRCGQPTTGCNHFAQMLFPVDLFPFTAEAQTDPMTGRRAGLYDRTEDPAHLPKVFHVNTGWEYWARANSLLHTALEGRRDVPEAEHERHYVFSCTQHSVEMTPFPPPESTRIPDSLIYRGNFQDYHFHLRALVMRMVEWIRHGTEPPPSRVPTFGAGTLALPEEIDFPEIRQAGRPGNAPFYRAWDLDYGPRFVEEGVIDFEPARRSGRAYDAYVSHNDGHGNEIAGIRSVELLAPLATYTPWRHWDRPNSFTNLKDMFTGMVIPFPRDAEEKARFDDPRPSLDTLYADEAAFRETARRAAEQLVEERLLLAEDVDGVVDVQGRIWAWIQGRPRHGED